MLSNYLPYVHMMLTSWIMSTCW